MELVALQRRILESAERLVKPGGRLIYATCSMLGAENEEQIAWFLKEHKDYRLLSIPDLWPKTIGGTCPASGRPDCVAKCQFPCMAHPQAPGRNSAHDA